MGLKWVGHEKGQAGIPGIPGRDLSDEEVEKLKEQGHDREFLLNTGLYVEEESKKRKKAKEEEITEV